jgi:hypothetical protein
VFLVDGALLKGYAGILSMGELDLKERRLLEGLRQVPSLVVAYSQDPDRNRCRPGLRLES